MSVVRVVFCKTEVSASGWSLVQRSPTASGVPECNHESYDNKEVLAQWGLLLYGKKYMYHLLNVLNLCILPHSCFFFIFHKSFSRITFPLRVHEEFKYLGTTLTNQNSIQEEIKCRLKLGNACYFRCRIFCLPGCYPKL